MLNLLVTPWRNACKVGLQNQPGIGISDPYSSFHTFEAKDPLSIYTYIERNPIKSKVRGVHL